MLNYPFFHSSVFRLSFFAVLAWTAIISLSTLWNIRVLRQQTNELATNTARASFNKDQAYRLWATSHGGVYVEPDERTPPSPWLAHIPDRDLETTDGKKLTLMNPAYMLRQMMNDYSELYGIKGRITGLIYLNPINEPDEWEKAALRSFERGSKEVIEYNSINGEPHLRLMRPMVMKEGCMKCHGHLGFKVGDIRGGVGVSVPMTPYLEAEARAITIVKGSHLGLWLMGIAVIGGIARRGWLKRLEEQKIQDELTLSARVFENGLEGIMITDRSGTILRVNPMFSQITGYSPEEVLGKNPRIFKSDRYDKQFYRNMWDKLIREGNWQGEFWNRRKDGSGFAVWEDISTVYDENGDIAHYIAVFRDITEKKEADERIYRLAHYDVLTGLPNRLLFNDRLRNAIQRALRSKSRFGLLFIDLDHFKNVNDTFGHPSGDELLKIVAERIQACLRKQDSVGRLGGDEFAVLIEGDERLPRIEQVATKIISVLGELITIRGSSVFVSASIGIAVFPLDGTDLSSLMKNADTAMYRAKESGRNNYRFYDQAMSDAAAERLHLETELRYALERDEFEVYYQPQICLATQEVIGAEALVRWNHPQKGVVGPDRFIPAMEENGLILLLGRRVLNTACQDARKWTASGKPIRVSVNVSSVQLLSPQLVQDVAQALQQSELDPSLLELEITESTLLHEGAETALNSLKELGLALSIDDFGTGYSSLSYLKKLPMDRLKIDRAFIKDIPGDRDDLAITHTILDMARQFNMRVTAEGVETAEQVEVLRGAGCDEMQGYLVSKPVPKAQFERELTDGLFSLRIKEAVTQMASQVS